MSTNAKQENPRFRRQAATRPSAPSASYFQNEKNALLVSWNPQLRETQIDVQQSWEKAAARAISSIQNSGFVSGIVELSSGSVVGSGLRMASRPDGEALGWDAKTTSKWTRKVESRFRAWAENPLECDAAGQMTFGQQQQAAYASYMAFGEIFGLMPLIKRPGSKSMTKVSLLPPSRIVNTTDSMSRIVQGVKVDDWGYPIGYRIRVKGASVFVKERDIAARDADGRPNVLHFKDPAVAVTRGISPLAAVLKVTRQVDQYADATLTSALIQTIFAAVVKTNIDGLAAFDGLMTEKDTGSLDVNKFSEAKGEWYDGASIDLTQHGRIAHLFPNDELVFTESKQSGQQFDHFMGWLLREIARGAGVTYESATGDYRGATYSSVRMAGAVEWLTVLRRRFNLIVPFCRTVFNAWLEEEIGTGRLDYPGGYVKFLEQREFASRSTWTGPARPQADDFKTARAFEVRKSMQSTTLAEIHEEYGRDWDDDMRQRAAENALAEELGLPKPWAATDLLQVVGGEEAALKDPGNGGSGEKIDPSSKKGGKRPPGEKDPENAALAAELGDDLDAKLEAELTQEDGGAQ